MQIDLLVDGFLMIDRVEDIFAGAIPHLLHLLRIFCYLLFQLIDLA